MMVYKGYICDFSEKEFDFAFSCMSRERQKAVLRKRFDEDRKRSVLGEYLARKAISEKYGIAENEIIIGRTAQGKPFTENVRTEFCISHSRDLAVCALSEKTVGVDCEFIRDINLRITKIACTDSEKDFVFSAESEEEKKLRFFKVWTAKEAYFKFLGTGITDLKSVSYEELLPFCKTEIEKGYIITLYEE